MAHYKISKKNINEFFGLFGKKKKGRKEIQKLIDNDPRLKAIDKEIERLNKQATDRLEPWQLDLLKKHDISVK